MNSDIEFLFNSRRAAVAFRDERHVFDLDLIWLGWMPWNDGDVFDVAGTYLGPISPSGRLYAIRARRGLTSPPPRPPTRAKHHQPPPDQAAELLPAGMQDVRLWHVARLHALEDEVTTPAVSADGLPVSADTPEASRPDS